MNPVPLTLGIVGCGSIFGPYVDGLRKLAAVRVVGCADIDPDRAKSAGELHDLVAYGSVEALLADDSVAMIVNLTPPLAHEAVSRAALGRGKHVYVEKPFVATLSDANRSMEALSHGGLLGCAPDTFLGPPSQTARSAIDAGLIGDPIAVTATIPHSRAEEWHPDPTFLFKAGGGPLLDMGSYYLTCMVNCLGAVKTVSGATRIGAEQRLVTAADRLVESVTVEVPTHAVAVLRFVSGVVGTLTASFDIWSDHLPHIEIYGTRGVMRQPDPCGFDGEVTIKANASDTWDVVEPVLRLTDWQAREGERIRGLGVADLVDSLAGRPHRTNTQLAYHVLEVLESIEVASINETVVQLTSTAVRPEPVCPGDLGGLAISAAD